MHSMDANLCVSLDTITISNSFDHSLPSLLKIKGLTVVEAVQPDNPESRSAHRRAWACSCRFIDKVDLRVFFYSTCLLNYLVVRRRCDQRGCHEVLSHSLGINDIVIPTQHHDSSPLSIIHSQLLLPEYVLAPEESSGQSMCYPDIFTPKIPQDEFFSVHWLTRREVVRHIR